MRYNKLGKSDIVVSEVGFGCMSLQAINTSQNEYLIHKAIASGINYFDTADLYDFGKNEKLLGVTLKGKRDKVVLATKVGNKWNKDKLGWTWDVSKEHINQAIDNSLSRLQTEYVDLYQIHGGTIEDDFEEVIETLENLIVNGKIRAYGISSIRPNVFLRFAKESNMVSNMMQYSLLDTRPEPYLTDLSKENVSVLSRGAFAQGLLVGKEAKSYLEHSAEQVRNVANQVTQLSNELDTLSESIALAYLLNYQRITSAVVGIRTEEHLDNVLKAIDQLMNLSVDFDKIAIPKIQYQSHLP
jgi:aryl-alcohol dehydrogenase-like predicted oxidoreductase